MMKSNNWFCVAAFCLLLSVTGRVQAQKLPLDKEVITGKLPNGLTYYIRRNAYEKGRAYLSLIDKAGSILETDEQRGLAHFMEHMNFNGTTHYPHDALLDFLQKAGVRFGADLNASTSYDETIYQLPLPVDQPGMLNDGLQVLRDWAQGALLDPGEIDQERGVILEEKRQRSGLGSRLNQQTLPLMVNYSRYAERDPIGTEKVLKEFKHETLRSFFRDWYRPDLQGVIVVGDIDVKQTRGLIEKLFADLKNPLPEKPRTIYQIPLKGKTQFLTVTDNEQSQTSVRLFYKAPHLKIVTKEDYRLNLVTTLFNQMVAARLQDIATRNSTNYISASAGYSAIVGDLDAFVANVVVRDDHIADGLKVFWSTISGIASQGFKEPEFQMAKEGYLSAIQAALREADKKSSQSYAQEYTRLFLDQEASPGIVEESKIISSLMSTISNTDIRNFAKQVLASKDRDIVITAPAAAKLKLPDEKQVDAWLTEAAARPTVDNDQSIAGGKSQGPSTLMAPVSSAGKVTATGGIPELNVTELTLSNGLKIVLKPTEFKNDQIIFTGIGKGGSSVLPDGDYISAALVPGIIQESGLGEFTANQLRAQLNGKQVYVAPSIEERAEKISGAAATEDLETTLKLIYMYFTSPRKDEAAFQAFKEKMKAGLAGSVNNPQRVFADTLNSVLSNHSPRTRPLTAAAIDQLDLDQCLAIYRDRFSDASAFTFTFVGNFQLEKITPLLEKYLGSLPSKLRGEEAKDLHNQIPAGMIQRTVYAGVENAATVQLVVSGDYEYNPANNITLQALNDILNFRLLERLREKEGGVYSPRISLSLKHSPKGQYAFLINFTCAPENSISLIAAVWDEIAKLKANGPSEGDLLKSVKENKVQNSKGKMTNEYWLSNLSFKYQEGLDPRSVLNYQSGLDALNAQQLKKDAQLYINEKNYIRVLMLPSALKP